MAHWLVIYSINNHVNDKTDKMYPRDIPYEVCICLTFRKSIPQMNPGEKILVLKIQEGCPMRAISASISNNNNKTMINSSQNKTHNTINIFITSTWTEMLGTGFVLKKKLIEIVLYSHGTK